MIRGLGDDAVEFLVLENLAEILLLFGLETGRLLDEISRKITGPGIDIAYVSNLNPGNLHRRLENGHTAPLGVASDYCKPNTVRSGCIADCATCSRNCERT